MPGENCPNKPPGDWKLKPYNGLDENHPIRRRFQEEQDRVTNDETDPWGHEELKKTTQTENYFNEMSDTKLNQEKVITKTEVKVKEVFIPKPCKTDFRTKQKYIRNCITNEIIGKITPQTETVLFDATQVFFFNNKK